MITPILHPTWLSYDCSPHAGAWLKPGARGHDTWAAAMTQLERVTTRRCDRRWLLTSPRHTFPLFPHTCFEGCDGDMGSCPRGLIKEPARLSQLDLATRQSPEDTGH